MKIELRKIRSIGILSFVSFLVAAVGLYWQWESRKHEIGGTMNATLHSRLLNSKESRTIVVCMDNADTDLSYLSVAPTFDNPSEFSLKDFSLSLEVETDGVQPQHTSFFTAHEYGRNRTIYKYIDNTLPAYEDTKKPFSHFNVTGQVGRCTVKSKASYDGAPSAFEYHTDVWFILEKRPSGMSVDSWKMSCKKRIFGYINEPYYDIHYFARGEQPEYQFDVALAEPSLPARQQVPATPQPAKEEPKVVPTSKTASNALAISEYTFNEKLSLLHADLNKAAEADGIYLLTYDSEDNGEKKSLYATINVRKGSRQIHKTLPAADAITNLQLHPEVPAKEYVSVTSTTKGYKIENTSKNRILCVFPYSEQSSYNQEMVPGRSVVMEKDDVHVFDLGKRFKDKVGDFVSFYFKCFLGIVFAAFILLAFLEYTIERRFSRAISGFYEKVTDWLADIITYGIMIGMVMLIGWLIMLFL